MEPASSHGWNRTLLPEVAMLIYLDDYRRAKSAKRIERSRLDDELQCVNWNPAFGVIKLSCFQRRHELSPELPEDSAKLETVFMNRAYALASQI